MDGNASSPQDLDAINRELITTRERFTALECRHAEVQQQLSKDRQQLVETESVLGETAHLCEEQKKRIAELEEETAYWKKCLFGRRSERSESPDQGHLFDDLGKEESQEASEPAAEESESGSGNGKRRRKSGGWGKIPDHIPRVEVIIDLPESERFCSETGEPLVKIGEDRTEQIEYKREDVFVKVIIRPKYALPKSSEQEGIAQAELPPSPVPGGRYGFGMLTEVLTNRFADHLPYYRQQDTFARCGLELSRSTLCNLTGHGSFLLEPLVGLMHKRLVASSYLGADDTPVRVMDPEHPDGIRTGRFWLYRGFSASPYNVFDFHESRSRDGPVKFLKDFTGWVTVDAYGVKDGVYLGSDSIRASCCNSHARRKFDDATGSHPKLSAHALGLYRLLYDIEERGKELSAADRLELRQQESKPIVASLKSWLLEQEPKTLPKLKIGEAIRYALNQWDELTSFLEDGNLPIDNNGTELALRSLTTGRNNWLFIGSLDAGDRAAIIYSVVSSAHRHHLDIWAYLHDVLERSARGDATGELLPDVWAKSHPESIRTYRQREQERATAKKRDRRQRRRALQAALKNR